MARNVRTYDHFCVVARALEAVGDRWSLLVVRDLLSGPKRFTDLMDRLHGITPKTLTQRLRELETVGVVEVDRVTGRREVRYQLTSTGRELGPVVEHLGWWGWRHAWRLPAPGEAVHPEHLLLAFQLVLDHEPRRSGGRPTRWHLRFLDDGEYLLEDDGEQWSVTSGPPAPEAEVDLKVVATTAGWLAFVADPTRTGSEAAGVEFTGGAGAVRRFVGLVGRFHELAVRSEGPAAIVAPAATGRSPARR